MAEKLDTCIRREQIAEAALLVAADEGLGGVTVKKVAARVGLTPSGLYRHYKNKSEILAAVLNWVHLRFQANIDDACAESDQALDILHGIMVHNLKTIRRYRILPLFFLSSIIWNGEPHLARHIRANFRHSLGRIAQILAHGQRIGQVRPDADPQCLAVTFIGAYAMPAMLHARDLVDADLDRLVETNWLLLREALTP